MSERGSCRASCFVGMDFQFLLELRRPSILMLMLIFVSFGFLYMERERGRKGEVEREIGRERGMEGEMERAEKENRKV